MKRDIKGIQRDLYDTKNNDIIWKKSELKRILNEDPDLKEVLGSKAPLPLNNFGDEDSPTDEELAERKRIEEYNKAIVHEQIIDYLKLNGIQKEVLNFIMFDIDDTDVSYVNNVIKNQFLIVMCLVHEDDMNTDYDIIRTDLLDYIIKDLLCWSNCLGMKLKCVNDYHDIIDSKYYARVVKFKIQTPNEIMNGGSANQYDRR